MYMQQRDPYPVTQEEFTRPVESIMRCENFKSNFARRLSNRYISRTPVSQPRQDTALKLCPDNNNTENIPERIEPVSQLSKSDDMEHNDAVKLLEAPMKNTDIRRTEVNALNMEVETLRWQLSQTESNRQMHIALLQQIVSFLNRVKEHIECQANESQVRKEKEELPRRMLPKSFNSADLPRSRSVFHVNKHHEYSTSPPKKMNIRKISKSISNVNGVKDYNHAWNNSKVTLSSETQSTQKISEEISRLITLANTVLSTKLPDLACTCNETLNELNFSELMINAEKPIAKNENLTIQSTLKLIKEDSSEKSDTRVLNTTFDSQDEYNGITDKYMENKDFNSMNEFMLISPISCGLRNDFNGVTDLKKAEKNCVIKGELSTGKMTKAVIEKRSDVNHLTSFVEDESGFSSMSSFQEIGIPIISIIPPSPCKDIGFLNEIDDYNEAEKWKTDSVELEKQAVKVFWV